MFFQDKRSTVSGIRVSGYRLGLKQPSTWLRPELAIPEQPDFVRIDNELLERFGIEPQEIRSLISRPLTTDEQSAQRFAWRTMALTCNLLETIKIPCFDQGVITDIRATNKDKRLYRVSCLLPAIEDQSLSWVTTCFERAYRLISQLVDPSATEPVISDLLEALHEKFVVEAKKQIPGGESTIPVLKTAFQADIPFTYLGQGIYQLGWGSNRRLSDRSTNEFDSAAGATISRDKSTTARILRQAGLPVPVHTIAGTRIEAAEAARRIGFPVVIKPADQDRGQGVTVNIQDAESASAAFDSASKLSRHILVERQVPGICHRILVTGDSSPYTVARLPLAVVGDGIHTVRELIVQANQQEARKAKHLRLKPFPADELAAQTLKERDLDFESIPGEDIHALLRPIETSEWGGLPKVFSKDIHPENVRIAIQAAKLMNLHVAGVDMISEDICKPWYENGAVINEINFAPYLGLRYAYQRAGIKDLVHGMFPLGARIPVEIFVGDESAWAAAQARLHALAAAGKRAFCSSHTQTVDIDGEVRLQLLRDGLYARCRALSMNQSVDALLLVVQTDELLFRGLPVDSISAITLVNNKLVSMNDTARSAASQSVDMLLDSFRPYLRSTAS